MDLNAYLGPLRKWWALLVVTALVAAISSYLVTRQQPLVYQARTTLVIGRSVFVPNPTGSDFWLGQQLATFYADYARREPVRNATMAALGLQWLPDYNASAVPNSQLIEIAVTDTSPERAQVVANELANQLIKQSPTSRESQALEHQDFVQQQLNNIEAEINSTMEKIAAKQEELGELFSARQIAEAEADLAALEAKLTTLQTNYASLLANSEQGASNTLSVIERAALPRRPIGPQTGMMVMLATAIGLILAAGAAYVIEYLDDTIKTPEEVSHLLSLPMIGLLAELKRDENTGSYVATQPRSVVADAYRSLRTNLEFAAVDKPLKTIYITSAGVSEGKTSIAINLAVVMAQGGKRVILLDADLRRPSVHRGLGLSNGHGLSDVFRGAISLQEAFTPWDIQNVRVVLSGSLPPNPADLLGSKKMDSILEELKQESDVVIVDGPPCLVADASVLASKVDGVILVIRHGLTRRDSAKLAVERLRHAGASILGVVINRIPRSSYRLYGSYGFETYYSGHGSEARREVRRVGKKPRFNLVGSVSSRLSGISENVRVGLPKLGSGLRSSLALISAGRKRIFGNGAKPAPLEPDPDEQISETSYAGEVSGAISSEPEVLPSMDSAALIDSGVTSTSEAVEETLEKFGQEMTTIDTSAPMTTPPKTRRRSYRKTKSS